MPEQTISLDQKRAAYAWECVSGMADKPWFNDYANLAKAAPALIMNNGLMQTLAFYEDKAKDHHRKLKSDILGWLAQREIISGKDYRQAMVDLHEMSTSNYRLANAEALEIVKWLRQLSATVSQN